MDPERWKQVDGILQSVLDRPPEERDAFLRIACGGEESLEREVRSLLKADPTAKNFLENPAIDVVARAFASGLGQDAQESCDVPIGRTISHYRIVGKLGGGGMGVVYKAEDPRLQRFVAVKFLSEQLAHDADALSRFRREARAASALNHPNICMILDIGEQDGQCFIVMEFLEGVTLQQRMAAGRLAIDTVVALGIEISDALDALHRAGIIHRDVKPGNIMLTKNGLKVLDFGLAKRASVDSEGQFETKTSSHIIAGTPAYMAPEQFEGKATGARTDIFALGMVLYEMAAGRRPLAGESHPALVAGIVHGGAAPNENIAVRFAHVVERCVAKDPEMRWQSVSDVKHELEWTVTAPAPAPLPAARRRSGRWIGLAALAGMALVLGVAAFWLRRPEPVGRVYRFSLAPPPDTEFLAAPNRIGLALSPDGRSLVFLGVREGQSRLWLQRLDSNTAHEIPGTENATEPFWSPDGRSLGFYAGPSLKRIDIDGANLRVLAKASAPRGGTWGPDGTIIFSPSLAAALYRVSATGGEAARITFADLSRGASYHTNPIFLDDGKHFLYSVSGFEAGVYMSSLDKASDKSLIVTSAGRVAVVRPPLSGHRYLVWERGDGVVAQKWDSLNTKPSGEIVPLAGPSGYRDVMFTVSHSGLLVYGKGIATHQIQLMDLTGKPIAIVSETESLASPALSPDEHRVAVVEFLNQNLIVRDLRRNVTTRVATGGIRLPVFWSPDGSRLGYARADSLVEYAVETSKETVLATSPRTLTFRGWMPDGRAILYDELGTDGKHSLWVKPIGANVPGRRLLNTSYDELHAAVSANGKWIAYVTDESGRSEVYVQALEGGQRIQVSNQGGTTPEWRRDDKDLFYQGADGSLVRVEVRLAGGRLDLSQPKVLFSLPAHYISGYSYDASPDGQRFLVIAPYRRQAREPLTVVVNWPALLPN